jgi:DNA polymerase-3 subunit epsilon
VTAIAFDTETTGLSKDIDRVIEVAVVWWNESTKHIHHRFNPGVAIPAEATRVHGITDADVKDCPPFREHAIELRDAIESAEAAIGYNPWFDQGMLDAEFARCGIQVRWPTLVCPKRVWDVYEPSERNLTSAYRRFVDRNGFDSAHSALADTHATIKVLRSQLEYFQLGDMPWEELDPERKLWWGPTHHVLIVDETLMMNFGKHRGKPVRDVDYGFWQWLIGRDFPKHLLLLAMEATRLIDKGNSKEVMDVKLYAWALEHLREKQS